MSLRYSSFDRKRIRNNIASSGLVESQEAKNYVIYMYKTPHKAYKFLEFDLKQINEFNRVFNLPKGRGFCQVRYNY